MLSDSTWITLRQLARWSKWKLLRVVQIGGLAMVAIGAYPILRPFLASVATPPTAVDKFVINLGIPLLTVPELGISPRAIVFIVVGLVVVWLATSRRTLAAR